MDNFDRKSREGYTLNIVLSVIALFGMLLFTAFVICPGVIEWVAHASIEPEDPPPPPPPPPEPTPPPTPPPKPTPTCGPGNYEWVPTGNRKCTIEVIGKITFQPPPELWVINIGNAIRCFYPIECTWKQMGYWEDCQGNQMGSPFDRLLDQYQKTAQRSRLIFPDGAAHEQSSICGGVTFWCFWDC